MVVRRLVALDIVLHGYRFIQAEFWIGTPVMFVAGLWLMALNVSYWLGLYLVLTGVNYLPLVVYTRAISKTRSAKDEVQAEMARDRHYVRKYSTQRLLLFVPLAVALLAIVQEYSGEGSPKNRGVAVS